MRKCHHLYITLHSSVLYKIFTFFSFQWKRSLIYINIPYVVHYRSGTMPQMALYKYKENNVNQSSSHYRRSQKGPRAEMGLDVSTGHPHPLAVPLVILFSWAISRLASALGLGDPSVVSLLASVLQRRQCLVDSLTHYAYRISKNSPHLTI